MISTLSRTLLLVTILALTGCIQRTITVTSEPPGALVYLNDEEVGRTPVTVPFTFYGTYDVRLEKQGFATLHTREKAKGPWWENPGPDLLAEAVPGSKVRLEWFYTLNAAQPTDEGSLVERARELRDQANTGSTPEPPSEPAK